MARKVAFSESGARRIIAATRAVERGNRDQSPIKFRQPGDDGGGGSEIKLVTFSGSWPKGTTKLVSDVYGGSGAEPFEVMNYFADISVDCGERHAAVALIEDDWVLIAAEC